MEHEATPQKIVLLILAYYSTSTITSCLTKQILVDFPRPVSVSLAQQFFSSVVGVWEHRLQTGSARSVLAQWRAILPVSLCLVVALLAYRISLIYNPVSFSQVCRAGVSYIQRTRHRRPCTPFPSHTPGGEDAPAPLCDHACAHPAP